MCLRSASEGGSFNYAMFVCLFIPSTTKWAILKKEFQEWSFISVSHAANALAHWRPKKKNTLLFFCISSFHALKLAQNAKCILLEPGYRSSAWIIIRYKRTHFIHKISGKLGTHSFDTQLEIFRIFDGCFTLAINAVSNKPKPPHVHSDAILRASKLVGCEILLNETIFVHYLWFALGYVVNSTWKSIHEFR